MEGLQELAQGLEAEVFVHAFRHATAPPCLVWGMGRGWVVRGGWRDCLRSGVNA